MTAPVERLLAMLADARKSGSGWSARCPAHDDRRASLSIGEGEVGRALVKCHAGCTVDAICAAVGLRVADLMPTAAKPNGKPRIVVRYDYRDEAGELLFQVVRFDPKDFRQRQPKPDRGWDWSVKGVRVVPYRLPELLAQPAWPVVIAEGEKDCDNLARIGVLATCNAGGAGKWTAEHSGFLRGRRVIVLPDNDDGGRKHGQQIAQSLHGIAEWVQIVELPGLPVKGDVSDWLAAGGMKEELKRLAEAAPFWTAAANPEPGPILTCLADIEPRDVSWLWPGHIPLGRITLLVGRPGEGKSFLTIDAAARVTTGTPWPDGGECPRGDVLLMTAEDDPADTIRPRLDAHDADVRRVHLLSAIRLDDDARHERLIRLADVDAIAAALERLKDCRLVVVDPIGSYLGDRTDAHRDNEVRSVLAPIAALGEKYGAAVLVVAHDRKAAATNADDLALGSRAFTGIARAVWHLRRDPQKKSRRLLLPGKANLSAQPTGLAFIIGGEPPRIMWERGAVTMTADDAVAAEAAMTKPGPAAKDRQHAEAFLRSALADGPRQATEVTEEACEGHGITMATLRRARQSVGIVVDHPVIPGPWWWRLPDAHPTPKDEEPEHLERLGENAGKTAISEAPDSNMLKFDDLEHLDAPNGELLAAADDEWGEI